MNGHPNWLDLHAERRMCEICGVRPAQGRGKRCSSRVCQAKESTSRCHRCGVIVPRTRRTCDECINVTRHGATNRYFGAPLPSDADPNAPSEAEVARRAAIVYALAADARRQRLTLGIHEHLLAEGR